MEFAALLRPLGWIAAPAAALSIGSFVAGMLIVGEDGLDGSAFAVASSGLLFVAVLGIAATALALLARLHSAGAGVAGAGIAVLGSVLVAGGSWTAVFVVPTLAHQAPGALDRDLTGVVIGYVTSYAVFAVGWVWTGIALARAGLVPRSLAVAFCVSGLLAFVPAPEPLRLLLISVCVTLATRRLTSPKPEAEYVPQPA